MTGAPQILVCEPSISSGLPGDGKTLAADGVEEGGEERLLGTREMEDKRRSSSR